MSETEEGGERGSEERHAATGQVSGHRSTAARRDGMRRLGGGLVGVVSRGLTHSTKGQGIWRNEIGGVVQR